MGDKKNWTKRALATSLVKDLKLREWIEDFCYEDSMRAAHMSSLTDDQLIKYLMFHSEEQLSTWHREAWETIEKTRTNVNEMDLPCPCQARGGEPTRQCGHEGQPCSQQINVECDHNKE